MDIETKAVLEIAAEAKCTITEYGRHYFIGVKAGVGFTLPKVGKILQSLWVEIRKLTGR